MDLDNLSLDDEIWKYRLEPEPRTWYVNLYPDAVGMRRFDTRADADERANSDRIGCIKLTEGQFDD